MFSVYFTSKMEKYILDKKINQIAITVNDNIIYKFDVNKHLKEFTFLNNKILFSPFKSISFLDIYDHEIPYGLLEIKGYFDDKLYDSLRIIPNNPTITTCPHLYVLRNLDGQIGTIIFSGGSFDLYKKWT